MSEDKKTLYWWGSTTLRLTHSGHDLSTYSSSLNAAIAGGSWPGTQKVECGITKNTKRYIHVVFGIEHPNRPHVLFEWSELLVRKNEKLFVELKSIGCKMDFYVGVHSAVIALGFDLPPTPTLWRLEIPIGIEFFS